LPVVGSGVEPGRADPPEPVNGVATTGFLGLGAAPTGAATVGGLWLDDPAGATGTVEPAVTAAAPPLPLALAAAASRAAEPPALLAAGVDGGSRKGVIAPWDVLRIGLAGFAPPCGCVAGPPPLGFAGSHGRLIP